MSDPSPVDDPAVGATASPRVTRLGDHVVNFYLVDHPHGLTLIDAGLPGHQQQLENHLAAVGKALTDISTVLLTHAHPDHIGLVDLLRHAGADIWIHERDAPILEHGPRSARRHAPPERPLARYLLRRPAALGMLVHLVRNGAFTPTPITGARTFTDHAVLADVPGQPHVIPLPGHTPGSSGFFFPATGHLFTGDALVTHDGLTGHTGPTLVCQAFTHDTETARTSLDHIDELNPSTLLPGHGDLVSDGIGAAVRTARERPAT